MDASVRSLIAAEVLRTQDLGHREDVGDQVVEIDRLAGRSPALLLVQIDDIETVVGMRVARGLDVPQAGGEIVRPVAVAGAVVVVVRSLSGCHQVRLPPRYAVVETVVASGLCIHGYRRHRCSSRSLSGLGFVVVRPPKLSATMPSAK